MRLLKILSREAHVINENNCDELDGQVTLNFYLLKKFLCNLREPFINMYIYFFRVSSFPRWSEQKKAFGLFNVQTMEK